MRERLWKIRTYLSKLLMKVADRLDPESGPVQSRFYLHHSSKDRTYVITDVGGVPLYYYQDEFTAKIHLPIPEHADLWVSSKSLEQSASTVFDSWYRDWRKYVRQFYRAV